MAYIKKPEIVMITVCCGKSYKRQKIKDGKAGYKLVNVCLKCEHLCSLKAVPKSSIYDDVGE